MTFAELKSLLTPPSKKLRLVHYLIVIVVLAVLTTVFLIYRQTSLRQPVESLFTLLPEDPICFVGVRNLSDAVETFKHSQFGRATVQMPIFAEIQRQRWWRQVVYQKQLWEYEMGGRFDFNKLKGYFGKEAILALYRSEGKISFLLITAMGAKERLEIAAVTVADPLNPSYKRLQDDYGGFSINTITGYPRDFSYAFIGKIGLLTLDESLIRDTIDIYAKKRKGFSDLHPMRKSLQRRYKSDGSTVFVDFPRFLDAFETRRELIPFIEEIDSWVFSNGYQNGTIRSHHRIQWKPERERRAREPATINPKLLSVLPGSSAVAYVDRTVNPSKLWRSLEANLRIQHQQREMDLTQHLGGEVTIALIDAASGGAIRTPSVIVAIPITNCAGLKADLASLLGHRILVNGKQLRFSKSQTYRGVTFQPVQLPLGFLFSLKGAYATTNDFWIISTTVTGLKSVIDTSTGESATLAQMQLPDLVNQPKNCHLLIQPELLISELKGFVPILSLIAPMIGSTLDLRLMRQVVANSSPIETLGPVSVGFDFEGGGMNVEVQVTVPVEDRS